MRLGLISCTRSKQNRRCKASEMYAPSSLFRAAYNYVTKNYDAVAILSAKYGLLLPDDEIEPYELTLKTMTNQQRKLWAEKVVNQLEKRIGLQKIKECYFHTGKEYREHLIPLLQNAGIKCYVPLKGLSIGKQIQWYKTRHSSPSISNF